MLYHRILPVRFYFVSSFVVLLQNSMYADPILERLDPQHLISYRLYRDATCYVDGKHLRDLTKLNRDLSRALFLTTEPEKLSSEREHCPGNLLRYRFLTLKMINILNSWFGASRPNMILIDGTIDQDKAADVALNMSLNLITVCIVVFPPFFGLLSLGPFFGMTCIQLA